MPDGSTLVVFCIASLSLLVTPGTEMLYVIARSTEQGRNAGFVSVLGVCMGDLIHLVAASAGLSAVLMTSASLYQLIKFMGAAYMIYIGVRMLLGSRNVADVDANQHISLSTTFFQATMSSILNPKIAIFFLAFLPQFIDSARKPILIQTVTLGAIWISMTFFSYTLLALTAERFSDWLRSRLTLVRFQKEFAGTVLIGLGIHLMLSKRK